MEWNLLADRPVYLQLMEQIQADIVSGSFQPGDKLPSVRDLASEAGVNPNTMQRAMTELERSGLIFAQRTSGRYITTDEALITQLKEKSAMQQAEAFLDRMEQLGFQGEQTIELLKTLLHKRERTSTEEVVNNE